MITFELYLHGNLASPRGMGIKILGKKNNISESFWSLVIDHEPNKEQFHISSKTLPKRAVATLHWVYVPKRGWHFNVLNRNNTLKIHTWKELYNYLKIDPHFSSNTGLKKLEKLLKIEII